MLWMLATILTCSLSVTGLSSCTTDNPDNSYYDECKEYEEFYAWLYELYKIQCLDSGYVSYYDLLWDMIDDHSDQETYDDQLYYDWATAYLDSLANVFGVSASRTRGYEDEWNESGGVKYATIRYKTIGADGSLKELSELVVYPNDADVNEAKRHLKNLVIGCHATITSDAKRPTNFKNLSMATDVGVLSILGTIDTSLVVIPDYEGYGVTSNDPHPYLDRDVTAQQVIDGAKAAVAWYEEKIGTMKPGWKSVTVGYSQGGAVAASVLRHYHANNMTDLNIIGALCGDGPYDPLATLNQYLKDDRLYMPLAAALMLKGMVDTNKKMKALGCTYQDFVTEKFYNTGIFDWLQSKSFTENEIQTKLLEYSAKHGGETGFTMMCMHGEEFMPYTPENIKEGDNKWDLAPTSAKNYCTFDQCFRPGVIKYFKSGTVTGDVPEAKLKAMEQALKENSLTYGNWKPSGAYPHAYYFFHSTRDEVVPFCNYEQVRDTWGKNLIYGHPDVSYTYRHVETGAWFYIQSGVFVNEILERKWAPGEK